MTEKIFHFVRNHEVPDWERIGWEKRNALLGTHHGFWSTLMEWTASSEPVKPYFVSNRVPEASQSEDAYERTEHRT